VDVLVLSRDQVAALLDVDRLIEALADGFRALSHGELSVPPRVAAEAPGPGLLAVMPGFTPSAGLVVKLVSVFPSNHAVGLPSHQAAIAVFDETNGSMVALLDGTHITAVRTAAASALSVRELSRTDARVLCILGAGVQGASHLDAVCRVREFSSVRIASRTHAHAVGLASRDPRAVAVESFEDAVRGADVVCCCTDSPSPVVQRSWLSDGAHVTSVGVARGGPEVDDATVSDAAVFVESRSAVVLPWPAGTHELAGRPAESITELGEVLLGRRPGRASGSQLTLYKSMGHAVEDAVAARLVLDAARAAGVGTTVTL
jgi:alanine dehydrogenase